MVSPPKRHCACSLTSMAAIFHVLNTCAVVPISVGLAGSRNTLGWGYAETSKTLACFPELLRGHPHFAAVLVF